MPVRIKQRALDSASGESEKHLESLRKQIIGLLLAWHMPITVSLKSAKNNKALRIRSKSDLKPSERRNERSLRVLDLPLVCNIFSQAGYIEPSNWGDWIKTSARTPFVKINGAISLRPAPSKHLQYISLGISPMNAGTGSNVLYHEVNRLFTLSSFGNQEEALDTEKSLKTERRKDGRFKQDGFTNKQLKGEGKGVDRWPMFYINIEVQGENTSHKDDVEKLGERALTGLIKVLGAMTTGFLDENHFRPRARLRARKITELRTPDVSRRGPESQGTSFSNVPMSRTQIRHEDDPFNGWGRIKSGVRVKPSCISPLISPGRQPMTGKASKATSPQIDSGAVSNISIVEAMDATHDESIIEWRNPISGAAVLVNARTGLVVSKQPSTRPATAPSKLGSRLSFTTSNLHTNPLSNGKTRLTRIMSSSSGTKAGSWSSDLLKTWQNPVFDVTEEAIPQVSLDGPSLETSDTLHGRHCCPDIEIEKAFKQSSSSCLTKLSRQALKDARIIAQVDQKFILVYMSESPGTDGQGQARQLLVLVDQHAADERIRVEGLLADLDSRPTLLVKPIAFEIPDRERALLDRHLSYFTTWGINYDVKKVADSAKCRLTVKALPAAIAERCRVEPKVLIELLRGEAWKREELGLIPKAIDHDAGRNVPQVPEKAGWLAHLSSCPQGLLDMLNSRACRSAIMFNDALTKVECETLIQRLAECAFPFQCAHGRPSTVPVSTTSAPLFPNLEVLPNLKICSGSLPLLKHVSELMVSAQKENADS